MCQKRHQQKITSEKAMATNWPFLQTFELGQLLQDFVSKSKLLFYLR